MVRSSLIPPLVCAAFLAVATAARAETPANVNTGSGSLEAAPAERPVAANRAQADGQYFGGRVTVGRVECSGGCAPRHGDVDYDLHDVEVRAARDDAVRIHVKTAKARGTGRQRRVAVRVALRPPGGPAAEGDLSLPPGRDLLDPANYAGTPLEDAFRQVTESMSAVTGEGGALERLTIVFARGEVVRSTAHVLSMSAAGTAVLVGVPVDESQSAFPPRRLVDRRLRAPPAQPRPQRAEELDRSFAKAGGIPDPGGTVEAVGNAIGSVLAGVCQTVGGSGCRRSEPPPPPLFVHLLSPRLFVDADGKGELSIGCPPGYPASDGELEIETEIRLGQSRRRLAEPVAFVCNARIETVRFHLLSSALDDLRDGRRLGVLVRVRLVTAGGRFVAATEDATLERR